MKVDELFERIEARLVRPTRRALAAVRPIYQVGQRGYPQVAGSGVLLCLGGRRILVTAAHVADHAERSPLLFAPGRSFRTLSGPHFATVPTGQDRTSDLFDLAVFGLTEEQEQELDDTHVVHEHEMRSLERPSFVEGSKTKYLVIGYPRSKQARQPAHGTINAIPLHPIVLPRPESIYADFGALPATHLLLEYDRANFALEQKGALLADPHGMSGGGVWRIDHMLGPEEPVLSLVGIMIEHHPHPRHTLVATRIGVAFAGVSRLYPELKNRLSLMP